METTKTYMPSGASVERKWYVIDAEGQLMKKKLRSVHQLLPFRLAMKLSHRIYLKERR